MSNYTYYGDHVIAFYINKALKCLEQVEKRDADIFRITEELQEIARKYPRVNPKQTDFNYVLETTKEYLKKEKLIYDSYRE